MVSWREASTDDHSSVRLLCEYFDSRARGFPAAAGRYRTLFPSAEQFARPRGVYLIVEGVGTLGEPADVGCGGIRMIEPGESGATRFEVKHLWLQPHARGRGSGRALLSELEARARALDARELVLDTNASLAAAAGLYRSSGFVDIAAYNDNPNATNWYGKQLP